jgi:hypothetical protein
MQRFRRTLWTALLLNALVLPTLSGCLGTTKPKVQGRPAWIDNPGDGASASAGMHVMGRNAQEELALSRAREELAKRQGVTIGSEHEVQQVTENDRSSTIASKTIREEVKDREVKAVLKSKWLDPANGTLWVWVVPSK